MSMSGKTVVITGSTSGIGLGIAQGFAAENANVVVNGLGDMRVIQNEIDRLNALGSGQVVYCRADMSMPGEIIDLIATAEKQFGAVDIVVNNAGVQKTVSIADADAATWDAIIAVNLSAAFHTMHHALPLMASREFGRVVNIASVHGLVASKEKAPYVASKFGLVGMSRVAALEYAAIGSRESGGVTINCICPGWTETALIEPQIEARAQQAGGGRAEGVRSLLSEKQPSLRMSDPSEIGDLAAWLCHKTAHNITGAAIPVDGGWTSQ